MKKSKKSRLFKSFEPVGMDNIFNVDLGQEDLGGSLGNLGHISKTKLFLNRYDADEMMKLLDTIGLIDHLMNKGIKDFDLEIDIDETMINYFRLYYKKKSPDNLLLDLRVSESKFTPKKELLEMGFEQLTYDMVIIEWLSAQNPLSKFDNNKPQLPGQKKPGLGILKYCFDMMYHVAKEVIKDGFLDIPDHMHGAIMYSKKFKFFNPIHEAILKAIKRDLGDYSMLDVSWGMLTGTVIEKYKKEPQTYDPSEQVFNVSDRIKRHYNSSKYKSMFNKYYKRKRYYFNFDEMVEKRAEILKNKDIVDL